MKLIQHQQDHLALCELCRARLAESQNAFKKAEVLKSYLISPVQDHLLFEQMKAYVEEAFDETDREIIDTHLSLCSQCKHDVADLGQTRNVLLASSQSPKPSLIHQSVILWKSPEYSRAFKTISLAAAAALVVLLTGLVFWAPKNEFEARLEEEAVQNQMLKGKLEDLERENKNLQMQKGTPAEIPKGKTLLVSLMDGNQRIELDQRGNLYGTDAYPEAYHDDIQAILSNGNLITPTWLKDRSFVSVFDCFA